MTGKHIVYTALGAVLMLLIPLVLQLTTGTGVDGEGFNWTPGDFIVAGVLIFVFGLALMFFAKKFTSPVYRFVAIAVVLMIFLLVWAELAVGIFGTPRAGS